MAKTSEVAQVFRTESPSGIIIEYEPQPRRLYRVNGVEVPSVTTVLDVLDKKGLPWWGMTTGIEGTLALINTGQIILARGETQTIAAVYAEDGRTAIAAGVQQIVDLLTANKLTVNHVRDKAGVRGVGVHDALELWAKDGTVPDPSMFPAEEQGYVRGLLAFLCDVETAKATACEVMVGSVEHGFAGRYDVRIKTSEPHQVVVHRTPKKGPQYALLAPGEYLGDLKSSKGVYSSHHRQLEAYEQASIECGYGATDGRGILHVSADGTYEFVRSTASFHDFRVVLDVWKSDESMKALKR